MELQQFLKKLTCFDLVLTANRRLSNYLLQQYDDLQAKNSLVAWESPRILPLSTWVELTYLQQMTDPRSVLTDFQEELLWQTIIDNNSPHDTELNVTATATLAKDTWRLIHQWQLHLSEIAQSTSQDLHWFQIWCQQFEQQCQSLIKISRSCLLAEVNKLLNETTTKIPQQVYLVGFDELTPSVQSLKQILLKRAEVEEIYFQLAEPGSIGRMSFLDQETEFKAMLLWAKEYQQQHPSAKIGCIVPSLNTARPIIATLAEDLGLSGRYNISAAKALLDYPIIHHALLILGLNATTLQLDKLGELLRSPFIQGAEREQHARSLLDVNLRRKLEHSFPLKFLLTQKSLNNTPLLLQTLTSFVTTIPTSPLMSLEQWAQIFATQLNILGWPGNRTLTSTEFQLVERFKKCFDELTTCHHDVQLISFDAVFDLFKRLVANVEFQTQSQPTPIQVLGLLEGVGIPFDFLWVAGLTNESWPAPSSPNPFLPFALQKKYGMPHATCERELFYSRNVMQRLAYNASQIIYSHAQTDNDRTLQPSFLITDYPEVVFPYEFPENLDVTIYHSRQSELLCDVTGPPLTCTHAAGGSGLFKAQAACPFQAFAKYRLGAESLEPLHWGLDARERGSLIHEVLALIWQQIQTQANLKSLDGDQQRAIINAAIEAALTKLQGYKPNTITPAFRKIEQQRLFKIVSEWLALETLRVPFTVVSCEEQQTGQIGKLEFRIQIDRIDKVGDDTYVIIDYKTGRTSLADWFSERPNEPQLPLYATVTSYPLSGFLFGQIRRDQLCFKGLAQYAELAPGATAIESLRYEDIKAFEDLEPYWQKILVQLGEDFSLGKADITPKQAATCTYCDLHVLCRVHHAQPIHEDSP